MKQIFLLLALAGCTTVASAQVDVKFSPIALLVPAAAVSVEVGLSEAWGIDGDGIIGDGGYLFNLSGKYYLNPEKGIDRFHIGAFAGVVDGDAGLGFLFGYKVVSVRRILFEAGVGLGRSFSGGFVGYGKLHVGYRF